MKIIIYFLLIIFLLFFAIFCYLFVGKAPNSKDLLWGVDFSQMQAESLDLSWRQLYISMMTDLGVKNIKLHTAWDWIEGEKDKYYFNDVDWQLEKANENNAKIIYVIGMKSGRWPECHIPSWAQKLEEEKQKSALLDYIKETVNRYKDNKAVAYWQVENEPLFMFGECPKWYYNNKYFLRQEVELVKSLDPSRKIIISDSGEYSFWFDAGKIGDIVGVTMYRQAWINITNSFGFYSKYLFSPVYYHRKAMLIKQFLKKEVICVELQTEPWVTKSIKATPLKEQLISMNPEIFDENVKFAKESGLDQFYLWGVEWWYWMKEKYNKPEIWNKARQLFN